MKARWHWSRAMPVCVLALTGCGAIDAAFGFKPDNTGPPRGATVGYSSQIGGDDADATNRQAMFAATNDGVLIDNRYVRGEPLASFDLALECQSLLRTANGKIDACAAELTAGNCGRGNGIFRRAECPSCADLTDADSEMSNKGCPKRPKFPPYRDADPPAPKTCSQGEASIGLCTK